MPRVNISRFFVFPATIFAKERIVQTLFDSPVDIFECRLVGIENLSAISAGKLIFILLGYKIGDADVVFPPVGIESFFSPASQLSEYILK